MIWQSGNPRALKGADKSKLPVEYRSQVKAWMTIPLFKEWIKEFDSHKNSQVRKVLLLMDNASVHRIDDAQILRLKATQIAFSQTNTTSQLQPMDVGIIQAFKLYYRRSLLSHNMHKVKVDITSNYLKDVTIALTIVWVFHAWCKVIVRPCTSASHSAASKIQMTPARRLLLQICPCLNSRPVILRNWL